MKTTKTPRESNFTAEIAKLGERVQDSGCGKVRVITHAGLAVTLEIRERHPSIEAHKLLVQILDIAKLERRYFAVSKGDERYRAQQELVRRKLVEISKLFVLVHPTKAGRIAGKRFRAMFAKADEKARAAEIAAKVSKAAEKMRGGR